MTPVVIWGCIFLIIALCRIALMVIMKSCNDGNQTVPDMVIKMEGWCKYGCEAILAALITGWVLGEI